MRLKVPHYRACPGNPLVTPVSTRTVLPMDYKNKSCNDGSWRGFWRAILEIFESNASEEVEIQPFIKMSKNIIRVLCFHPHIKLVLSDIGQVGAHLVHMLVTAHGRYVFYLRVDGMDWSGGRWG